MLITKKQLLLLVEVLAHARHEANFPIPSATMKKLHNDIVNQQSDELFFVHDKRELKGKHQFRKQKMGGHWSGNK